MIQGFNFHYWPRLVPDRFIRRELKKLGMEWAGTAFADIAFRQDEGALCLVERSKPTIGFPQGYEEVIYPLVSDEERPRQADWREVDSVRSRLYGARLGDQKWLLDMKSRRKQRKLDLREEARERNINHLKGAHALQKRWRSTTYVGAPPALNEDAQYPCGCESGLMAAGCPVHRTTQPSRIFMSG